MSQPDQPNYIVVEGPLGVGKTTFCRRLAESIDSELMLERAEENPFLERFYQDRVGAALPTQLHFLFQRGRQLTELRQGDLFRPRVVADFMMQKDRLFAELNLDEQEFALYEQVYQHMDTEVPVPDLVVYLQAPVEVLLERIQRRARLMEAGIDAAYVQRLADAYTDFFYHYHDSPLLIVNAAEIDFAHSDNDFELLREQVLSTHSGRHYFNPVPLAL